MSEGKQEPGEDGVRKTRDTKTKKGVLLNLSTFHEDDMFAILLNDALKGVNIRDRYPDLYRQLRADERLWQVFVDSLEALETPLAELPQPSRQPDLGFLQRNRTKVNVEPITPGRWLIQLRQTAQELYKILFTPPPQTAPVRTTQAMMMEDENDIVLLSETVSADEIILAVSLNVTQTVATPDELGLYLSLWPTEATRAFPYQVRAEVVWGEYVAKVMVKEPGRVTLPSLPYQAIHTAVQANLYLNVDVATTE